MVRGWLNAFGPAYELQSEEIIGQVREACLAAGFREFSWSMMPSTIARSLERWRKLRSRPLQPRIVSDATPASVTPAVPAPQTPVSSSELPWD